MRASLGLLVFIGWMGLATAEPISQFADSLKGVLYTTPNAGMPLFRFELDRVEGLSTEKAIVYTFDQTEIVEGGLIRKIAGDGRTFWWAFSEDRQSCLYVDATAEGIATLPGHETPVAIPASGAAEPLEVNLDFALDMKKLRVWADRVEGVKEGGTETWNAKLLYPNCLLVDLRSPKFGCLILSREKAQAWWVKVAFVAPSLKLDMAGAYRRQLRTEIDGYPVDLIQFCYLPLRAGRRDEASALEWNGLRAMRQEQGENSESLVQANVQLGTFRRWNRDYDAALAFSAAAWERAKTFASPSAGLVLRTGLEHANRTADAGKFPEAAALLKELNEEVSALAPADVAHFDYNRTVGAVKFGLRDFDGAAKAFLDNKRRAQELKNLTTETYEALPVVTCELAANDQAGALSALAEAIRLQDELQKANPRRTYDTWTLALACANLERWDDALRFAPLSSATGSWVTYQEYVRMLALTLKGDRAEASKLAAGFTNRFKNLSEVEGRTDIDDMLIKLTTALALQTGAAIVDAENQWKIDVLNLKNRPLANYLLARVIVRSLAKLRQPGQ